MKKAFADLVEAVKQLDPEEKLELKGLLDKYLIEERRHEIHRHFEESQHEEDDLSFSSDIDDLKSQVPE